MPKNIAGSVGKGGLNRAPDAATIQYLLNCVPKSAGGPTPELAVDGICGPLTKAAILKFQMARGGYCDGRVDSGGPTLKYLQGYDPYPMVPMPPRKYRAGAAAQKAACHSILGAVGKQITQMVLKGYGGKTAGGGMGGAAAITQEMAEVIKKATEAAGKMLEQAARTTGLPVSGGGSGGGLSDVVKKAMEAAKRAAEETAKQGKIPMPPGGFDWLPNNPGFPSGGGGGMADVVKKVADAAMKAAEQAAKAGGKVPIDIPKISGLDEVPQKVTEIVKQVGDTTNKMIDFIVKAASQAAGGGGKM